jgi:hypothetical protein
LEEAGFQSSDTEIEGLRSFYQSRAPEPLHS